MCPQSPPATGGRSLFALVINNVQGQSRVLLPITITLNIIIIITINHGLRILFSSHYQAHCDPHSCPGCPPRPRLPQPRAGAAVRPPARPVQRQLRPPARGPVQASSNQQQPDRGPGPRRALPDHRPGTGLNT